MKISKEYRVIELDLTYVACGVCTQDLAASVTDMSKGNDWFLVANDFAGYMEQQEEVDKLYKDVEEWTKRSILMTAGSGFFSSDRTIAQYADEIWDVKPTPVP
jgi:starch phosphorylase